MPEELLSIIETPLASEADELALMADVLSSMNRRSIRSMLLKIAENDESIAAVAGRSSIHSNGFVKLVLERERGMALRLHVWDTGRGADIEPNENIHDHVWAFASLVLVGRLDEQRFVENSVGAPANKYRYIRDRATLPPGKLEHSGFVRLRKTTEIAHPVGVPYRVDSSLLHRARNITDQGLGATLAIMGVQRKQNAWVFAEPDSDVRQDKRQAALSVDETIKLIQVVADAI